VSNHEEKITIVEDANIVAYLVMKGFIAIPYIKKEAIGNESSRVAWEVQGDIKKEVDEFYNNSKVDVYSFVRALKDVRAEMYNIKQINNQLKEDN